MIWLTWRQFRSQFLTALAILAALAIFLLYLGLATRHSYDTDILGCLPADGCDPAVATERFLQDYDPLVTLTGIFLVAVPAIIGIFFGAPLIARELEANTQRLVWNQGVTRTRWLAVKLAVIGLVSVAVTGAFSLLLTWAASRYDQVQGNRFEAIEFASRNIVPLGYAVFAFVLGTAIGLVLRRTLPAMAATLLLLAVVQIVMPNVVRPHLQAPVTEQLSFSTELGTRGLSIPPDGPVEIHDFTIPGALMLTRVAHLSTESGDPVGEPEIRHCLAGPPPPPGQLTECIAEGDYYLEVSYQPAERYWSFQWRELAILLVPTVLLSGFVLWRIRRVPG